MDNKHILEIGAVLADFNQEAAMKFGNFVQEKLGNPDKKDNEGKTEYKDKERIDFYDAAYNEVCDLFDRIKEKWGTDNIETNLLNPYYQRDLLYLYDRITLDMNYLKEYPEDNNEWLEKLLELKYKIRNLM